MPWLIPGCVFLLSRLIYHWTHPCSCVPRLFLPTGGEEGTVESRMLPGLRVEGSLMPCTQAALGKSLSQKISLLQILTQKGVKWAAWWTLQKIRPCPRTCQSVRMWKRGLCRLSEGPGGGAPYAGRESSEASDGCPYVRQTGDTQTEEEGHVKMEADWT